MAVKAAHEHVAWTNVGARHRRARSRRDRAVVDSLRAATFDCTS